ncbi:hypothetical protein [Streptomyces sp. NPDC056194]|uniref:hypothetical protein n=1 Tax=unclassified Streptomyces TaxID=2593676 RepID=UPI0035D9EEF3
MSERLRKLGIRLAEARSTALFQLATEPPAAVLARTLDIDITVAVKWQRAAAGDWAVYAAEISQRATHHLRGEDAHAPRWPEHVDSWLRQSVTGPWPADPQPATMSQTLDRT